MALEFVPISIRSIMSADVALGAMLGAGEAMRVYPVEAPDEAVLPYVVYHQMQEQFLSTKEDVLISEGWEMMLTVHAKSPGAYMKASRIARLARKALSYQKTDVLDDNGDTFKLKLKPTGTEDDITPETEKEIISIALTFRGTKTN